MATALMRAKDSRKTVMKQGLASYFTHSMLQGLFTNELTPFQCQQTAQICFSLTKMMIFESQWIWLVNEVARRNLECSQMTLVSEEVWPSSWGTLKLTTTSPAAFLSVTAGKGARISDDAACIKFRGSSSVMDDS